MSQEFKQLILTQRFSGGGIGCCGIGSGSRATESGAIGRSGAGSGCIRSGGDILVLILSQVGVRHHLQVLTLFWRRGGFLVVPLVAARGFPVLGLVVDLLLEGFVGAGTLGTGGRPLLGAGVGRTVGRFFLLGIAPATWNDGIPVRKTIPFYPNGWLS